MVKGGVTSSSRNASTVAGSVLAVRDQDGAEHDNEMLFIFTRPLKNGKTAELRAVLEAARAHTERM